MADLLVEVGTEEIPAGFLSPALRALSEGAHGRLAEAHLQHGLVSTMGTPRRLILHVSDVADTQPDLSETIVGPPARIAFDDSGAPTKAAIGFAKKSDVDVDSLTRSTVDGKSGEYVVCNRHVVGKPARDVLPSVTQELIRSIPWPKSMRWHYLEEAFVRPIHWLTCVLDSDVLPVAMAGIESSNRSRGHRFLAPQPITVTAAKAAFVESLRRAFVVADVQSRRDIVNAELARIEKETGHKIRPDEQLVDEVTNLVEYPTGVCGTFDESYLEVPDAVIVSAMRSHQRYFAMEDAEGRLVNRFATIAGTVTTDMDVVRRGNERVLAARLADARFFFEEDRKRSLDAMAEELSGVVFQAKLGSIGDKVQRISANAIALTSLIDGAMQPVVRRAAALCKADLVSHMVGEFPDLQGTVGCHYAKLAGEPSDVANAIAEHYQPRGANDALPHSNAGAALGIADRIDTLVGCFAVGLAPTGSADPYGLRRAAVAILTLILDREWTVSLDQLVTIASTNLAEATNVSSECRLHVADFLRRRLRSILTESESLPADCVDAALASGYQDVVDARARARAVSQLRERADFEPLAAAFKRVANILKGQNADQAPDPQHFSEAEERHLWDQFREVQRRADEYLEQGDYARSLQVLAELKGPVDQFFDAVMVMAKDETIRRNRLALLACVNATFTRIADFRQLAVS